MGQVFAKTMFSEAAKRLQERYGSRAQYQRLADSGERDDALGPMEQDFIAQRDTMYMSSVTVDAWPYVQHRGGPKGFLRLLDGRTLAFADFAGNKQYITTGNLETNDRVTLFLIDYPGQGRLKIIGHAKVVEGDTALEAKVRVAGCKAKVERVVVIAVTAFDWNCSQHITQRWTKEEIEGAKG